jgi:hypothetical protein
MEITRGKLTNLQSKTDLAFSINPSEVQLQQNFDYLVEPRVGKAEPVVSYKTMGPASLSFQVVFDKDADDKANVGKVQSFMKALGKVDTETRSVPGVQFKLGTMEFNGYVKSYTSRAVRFDNKGDATSVRLEVAIISDGSYEKGSA